MSGSGRCWGRPSRARCASRLVVLSLGTWPPTYSKSLSRIRIRDRLLGVAGRAPARVGRRRGVEVSAVPARQPRDHHTAHGATDCASPAGLAPRSRRRQESVAAPRPPPARSPPRPSVPWRWSRPVPNRRRAATICDCAAPLSQPVGDCRFGQLRQTFSDVARPHRPDAFDALQIGRTGGQQSL